MIYHLQALSLLIDITSITTLPVYYIQRIFELKYIFLVSLFLVTYILLGMLKYKSWLNLLSACTVQIAAV